MDNRIYPVFLQEDFRNITKESICILRPFLENSKEDSCEFSLTNLYAWKDYCKTQYQIYNDRLYIWFSDADLLIFTTDRDKNNEPEAKELFTVSRAMKEAGHKGVFYQVRKETLEKDPSFADFFHITLCNEETAEYIYDIKKLSRLPGQTLAKKRNLLHQFGRDHANVTTTILTEKNWHKAKSLAEKWYSAYPGNKEDLAGEVASLANMEECFHSTGLTGILVEENGETLAFAAAAPITENIWTETLEKALPEHKGAAQFANNELSKLLEEKCIYLNREQDLGLPGLRQAKLSYLPEYLLRNYVLTAKG